MLYHYPAKVRRRRTVLGFLIIALALALGLSAPMVDGRTVVAIAMLALGFFVVVEANRG